MEGLCLITINAVASSDLDVNKNPSQELQYRLKPVIFKDHK